MPKLPEVLSIKCVFSVIKTMFNTMFNDVPRQVDLFHAASRIHIHLTLQTLHVSEIVDEVEP